MAGEGISCSTCGAPLSLGQQYCVSCGARSGPRRPEAEELMRRASGRASPAAGAPAGTAPRRWRLPLIPLPSRLLAVALVLVFLGSGVALGEIAHRAAIDSLIAAERGPLRVLVASRHVAPKTGGTTTAEEPSPELAPTTPTTPTTPNTVPSTPPAKPPAAKKKKPPAPKLPPVRHVFIVMLANQPYENVFTPISAAPYLAKTLTAQGIILGNYYAVAHNELANAIALVSGQGPTAETARNCPNYSAIAGARKGSYEQVLGAGCVYPASTKTLPGQLAAKNLSWRAYVQGIDEGPTTPPACAHPALGHADPDAGLEPAPGAYTTARNPFVYFASITGSTSCARDDVGLSALAGDLASGARTPNLAYIVPDRCNDGSATPCRPGAPAGLAASEPFLKRVVPEITKSKAFKENGLLVITVDQAPSSGEFAESGSCCAQPRFPNLGGGVSGGGDVGALLISPYIKGDEANEAAQEELNHFSLLRTIEKFFGLPAIGYAANKALPTFSPALFDADN
ncbi:MAG TPA: alkaline phosphatase family protein [Solirubrobacteraceae bacterium]|nr:alkaline phosphatase family protein [Solirubrobacteraceae bacterium]